MSGEFMDFLKHKYAYVAIGEFKPGRFPEAQRLFEKAVSTYKDGFKGSLLLQKPGTDEGIAVIKWTSIEDMDTYQDEAYQKILAEIAHLFATSPITSFYEISSEIGGYEPSTISVL
jgi:hypothetical protein